MDYSSLPVRYTADIVICGGGTAGAFAAIAAAQEGKDVLVIEQFGMVGGSATAALVTPVMHSHIEGDPPCSYISEEVRKRLLALGAMQTLNPAEGDPASLDEDLYGIWLEFQAALMGIQEAICKIAVNDMEED